MQGIPRPLQTRRYKVWVSYIQGYSFGVIVLVGLLVFPHPFGPSRWLHDVQPEIKGFVLVISVFVAELLHMPSMQEEKDDDRTHNGNSGSEVSPGHDQIVSPSS